MAVALDRPSVADYQSDFKDLPADSIVCGFSLGAIVAAQYADRIKPHQLILFGLNPHADDPRKEQSRRDLERDVIEMGGAAALKLRPMQIHGQQPDKTRDAIYAMAEASSQLITAQTALALNRPSALPALARSTMPVLSLTGTLDQSAPPSQGIAAAEAAPRGTFRELDGLGHFALIEDPAACAMAVKQLMDAA